MRRSLSSLMVVPGSHKKPNFMWAKNLSITEYNILRGKDTEPPFTHCYTNFAEYGIYHCRACNTPLYHSDAKFNSGCGWPAFSDSIDNHVERRIDDDGERVEIVCAACEGHLGHVFSGEGFKDSNKGNADIRERHCVNGSCLSFVGRKPPR